jgi:hypothetical protein
MGIGVPERLKVVTHANACRLQLPVPFPHTRFEFDPRADAKALVDLLERRLAGGIAPAEPIRMPFVVEAVGETAERGEGAEWHARRNLSRSVEAQ